VGTTAAATAKPTIMTPRRPISNPAMVLHPIPKRTASQEPVVNLPTRSRLASMINT
jgi:hypothetical protein